MQAEAETDIPTNEARGSRKGLPWPDQWIWRILMLAVIALLVVMIAAWFGRERIAEDLIDGTLKDYGIEADYDIVSIGAQRQTIANLVVGDPQAPDFTAELVHVDVTYPLGVPGIGRVELVRPRLYGSYREGVFSLGALDPLIYAESDAPPGLPELNVSVVDGRALIDSDFGRVGAKLSGAGRLDDGFAGVLAATAPGAGIEGCAVQMATAYGELRTENGRLGFDGPVRFGGAQCGGAVVQSVDIAAKLELSKDFTAMDGDLGLDAKSATAAGFDLAALRGSANLAWRFDGELSVQHDLAGEGLQTPYASVGNMGAKGTVRSVDGLARAEWSTQLDARDISADTGQLGLADALAAAEGTFAATLLAKVERGLANALEAGRASANLTVRADDGNVRAIMPEARLLSGEGETIIALSRLSFAQAGPDQPRRLTGNFLTGGTDLPRINGRMEQSGGGGITLRMTMADYREGTDAVAMPRIEVQQDSSGRLSFNGIVQAEGRIPGGQLRGLTLPVEGTWSNASGLAIGRRCTRAELGGLALYDLVLAGRAVTLCPVDGGAIATYSDTFRFAARTDDLALNGEIAGTPASVTASSTVFRYPGPFRIDALDVVIGPQDNAVRLSAAGLEGAFDDTIGGQFEGAAAAIDAVPLDLSDMTGSWSFADSILRIGEGSFTVSERIDPANGPFARFEPLAAQGATLTLENNAIRADAALMNPASGRLVTEVAIRHDLSSSAGSADLNVPGITFNDGFQPDDLTYLTTGVIASVAGTVTGEGRIDWSGESINSAGTFRTAGLDFAAAFGPVRDVEGQIAFTDLLGLTTAPGQVLTIGSVNPGIEALGGRIVYSMTDGTTIRVDDGRWPFMGGELVLRPVTLDYGGGQGQDYIFELIALDAATFVSQMELTNLGATGTFDGTIPISFDATGDGTINGGLLISRPPGGNVAYVGELTYEDLGTMGNYAFQALRSLDYNQMVIELNGNLAGEIITNLQFDGIRQGEGSNQNFITRRLAKLPIRFKLNVRSESFFLLSDLVRGLFDPTYFDREDIRQMLGVDAQVQPIPPSVPGTPPPSPQLRPEPGPANRDEPAVQPPESDTLP